MSEDLGSRLRRLGVTKGTKNLNPPPDRTGKNPQPAGPGSGQMTGSSLEGAGQLSILLPSAYRVKNELGACTVLDHVYPLSHRHGGGDLGELRAFSTAAAASFCRDGRLAEMAFEDFIFLDTETTGLMGAGTLAFMVGVAFFELGGDTPVFIVRQFFLRNHADEPAMLAFLAELLAERGGLVTFNGRAFDLPLLDNRFVLNRMDDRLSGLLDRPHIDLLPPSRRLWRKRIGSCSLGSLEQNILQVQRGQEDVPGWMIPTLYMDYLRSGDASELLRVFYHNRLDMLSMVILTAHIMRQFDRPREGDEPQDLISLALWQNALGLSDYSESTLQLAMSQELPLKYYHEALHQMGYLLKRSGRRGEAALQWQQIAVTHVQGMSPGKLALDAHVELAKHYEWHQHDLLQAQRWTQEAISLVDSWDSRRSALVIGDLVHRMERLERKINRSAQVD